MLSIKAKMLSVFVTVFAAFAVFATTASADTTVTVSGNGADSENAVEVVSDSTTDITQANDTIVTNDIRNTSNSGNNTANENTGGDVLVDTGAASATTSVTTTGSSNTATVGCGCEGNTTVAVNDNGARSLNALSVRRTRTLTGSQVNTQDLLNTLRNRARSGGNTANLNTGGTDGGTTSVLTNNATSSTTVTTNGSANTLDVTGTEDGSSGGGV